MVFAIQWFTVRQGNPVMSNLFALHTYQSPLFKPWQFISYMFLHDTSSIWHLAFNMLALWVFGATLEDMWGPRRFALFYLACGLGAAFCHMLVLYFENNIMINEFNILQSANGDMNQYYYFMKHYGVTESPGESLAIRLNTPTIGASGAVFGCLAAFGYLFPNRYLMVYFFIPLKVKWLVLIYIGSELLATARASAGDNVAHIAHLGGALVGFLLVYYWNKTNRRTFY
ncbi:rhomboid family intramembrane serine protease [Deminuibacter soli]|nr:rhomboid family intramembrane serine protease [Deminuibacter soli]